MFAKSTRTPTAIRASTSRVWRYAVVAVVAFTVGSATVVTAATNGIPIGSLFYLPMVFGVASTPCRSDPTGANTTCTAVVDSKGQLSVSDGDTHKSLNQLQFDASGNLKTTSQGTSTISGTVSVSNFPATQNVNITGGTVSATQSVATTAFQKVVTIAAKHTGHDGFNPINASFISVSVGLPGMYLTFSGPLGRVLSVGPIKNEFSQSFTQRIPINSVEYNCYDNIVVNCVSAVTIIGD
jgi:hypothetical protein